MVLLDFFSSFLSLLSLSSFLSLVLPRIFLVSSLEERGGGRRVSDGVNGWGGSLFHVDGWDQGGGEVDSSSKLILLTK